MLRGAGGGVYKCRVLLWLGCCQEMEKNSMIGYLNKPYLEGRKNEMKLKTLIKKQQSLIFTGIWGYLIFLVVCTIVMFLSVFRHDYTTILFLPCLMSALWEMVHVQQKNTKN